MKQYLMKSMAVAAVAVAMAGCSHDKWNENPDTSGEKARQYQASFMNQVMGNESIDPAQTWNTAVTTTVSTTVQKSGTLKVYTKNPVGNTVAPLYEAAVTSGQTLNFSIARPQDATKLYAAIVDADGYIIDNMTFDASSSTATIRFAESKPSKVAKRANRAIQPSFNFPADADASKFLADVPAGIEKLAPGIGKANHYIDATYEGELNVWGIGTEENGYVAEGGTLYVKGNCDFSSRNFYFAGNSELYLVAGATLTLGENNGSGNLQTNTKIYIAKDAKLIANGELKLNNGLHIYNHGTIEAPKLSTNSNSVLYNVGTVTVTNKISVENELSVIVNDGTITAADLNTAGSGKFMNNNKVTISGNTVVNSNDNTWVNNGTYRTGYFFYHAASDEVINNCKLTVDEDFNINLGDNPGNGCFKMDAGAGVVTKNFNGGGNFANATQSWVSYNGGPFYIYMGAGSVFKVTETATMNATKADYGIYGPNEGDYAVFQAKDIVAGKAEQGYEVTYGGNLFVASDTHFDNGFSGDYPYIAIKGNAKVAKFGNNADVKIDETTCNPGYEGRKIDPDPKQYVYFAFEDLGSIGDFDFNDVVLRICQTPETNGKYAVELCAVGGTLETYIYNDTERISDEVHTYEDGVWVFGTNTMSSKVTRDFIKINEVTVPAGKTPADLNICIQVTREVGAAPVVIGGAVETKDEDGVTYKIPYRIVVNGDADGKWHWAREYQNITTAYPQFGKWGHSRESNTGWYLYENGVKNRLVQW